MIWGVRVLSRARSHMRVASSALAGNVRRTSQFWVGMVFIHTLLDTTSLFVVSSLFPNILYAAHSKKGVRQDQCGAQSGNTDMNVNSYWFCCQSSYHITKRNILIFNILGFIRRFHTIYHDHGDGYLIY